MIVLGISAFYHDSATALVRDGRIVAAAQEERFSRRKNDPRFPSLAIRSCLTQAGVAAADVDWVVFYEKPFLKFERLIETFANYAPRGFRAFARALPPWLSGKLFLKDVLQKELNRFDADVDWSQRLLFSEHHLSHAASAFYPSPFREAAILTIDGVGEWATTTFAVGEGADLEVLKDITFPDSLGLLYSAFSQYLGFEVNSGEYKLMGLAPYGVPTEVGRIREHLIDIKPDGSFRLNLSYFDYCSGDSMIGPKFSQLFGIPARLPGAPLSSAHLNLAASIQSVTEDVLLGLARSARQESGLDSLCLAGGVALNAVANGRILREAGFSRVWVQPAAGDAGGAIGAALVGQHLYLGQGRDVFPNDGMQRALLGPEFGAKEIFDRLSALDASFDVLEEKDLVWSCARLLAEGKILGWFQGRMEFGPRSLGCRSILADPRRPEMQWLLNHRVKQRESFRPFAPAILQEVVSDWFDFAGDSPYMTLVAPLLRKWRRPEDPAVSGPAALDRLHVVHTEVPAVTHVDFSARLQTVDTLANPRFRALLLAFYEITGCPMLLNTSFNVQGEPIVCTPEDAYHCFVDTGIDALALGNCLLERKEQEPFVS